MSREKIINQIITFKHSPVYEVVFSPLNNGRWQYHVTICDLLDGSELKYMVDGLTLDRILANPARFFVRGL